MELDESFQFSILDEESLIFYTPNFDCCNHNEFLGLSRHEKEKIIRHSRGINEFLNGEAFTEQSAGLNTTFLLMHEGQRIAGFVSLCSDRINLSESEQAENGLPYSVVPAIKIARLGVDKNYQGRKLSRHLVNYTVGKAFQVRQEFCGVKFLTVDCYEHRVLYYEHLGFEKNGQSQNDNELLVSFRLNIDKYLEELIGVRPPLE